MRPFLVYVSPDVNKAGSSHLGAKALVEMRRDSQRGSLGPPRCSPSALRRAPEFVQGIATLLGVKRPVGAGIRVPALGIGRVAEPPAVDGLEQLTDGAELRAVRGGVERDRDARLPDADVARGLEQVLDDSLCLGLGGEVRPEHAGQVVFGVHARHAQRVHEELVLAHVVHELAVELRLLDGDVWGRMAQRRLDERRHLRDLSQLALQLQPFGRAGLRSREPTAQIAFPLGRAIARPLEVGAVRIGDDRPSRIGDHLAAVELVEAPALRAVLERVLLDPRANSVRTSHRVPETRWAG